jgi:two-component system, OmpR family, response regulator
MVKTLVVDGDATVATFISRAFRSRGWQVDTADNESGALELALTGRYRLIILDLVAPRVNGMEVLRKVRAARPAQKVIVLTGLSGNGSGAKALELGAADYLGKPFSVDELLARASARLQEEVPAAAGQFMCCGGVTLNLARRKVNAGQGEVSLTEREFVLLAHLMSDKDRVFSRQELLSEVWGFSFDPGSNVVDVYIRRLRSKLGGDVIETVRNVGYALRAS